MTLLDSSGLAVSGTPLTLGIIVIASYNRNVALLHMRCMTMQGRAGIQSSAELACTCGAFST